MTAHLAWYLARASGILAWALASAAVIWGLLLSCHILGRRPTPRWLLDMHRFLGGLSVVFVGMHVAALVADNYVHFGIADVLVPLVSHWRRGGVALGVLALWLLAAVEITSLLMRHLPRRRWHQIHLASYAVFWLATLHAILAGTDSGNALLRLTLYAAIIVVTFLSLVRALQVGEEEPPKPRVSERIPAEVRRPAASNGPRRTGPSTLQR